MRTPILRLCRAAIAALIVAGCHAGATGSEGNFTFTYDTDDPTPSFDTPIAIGAQIDLRVEDPLTSTPLPITQATVDDPGVLAIVAMEQGRATIRGIGEGRTTVRVTATRRGESVSDSIELGAAAVRSTELGTGCAGAEEGVYLASSRLLIPYELGSAPGQPLIGYGLVPFEIAPPSALTFDTSDRSMQYLALRSGPDASRATITSTVDDARLYLEIVPEEAIDGARLRPGASGDAIAIGASRFVLVQPEVGDRVLCQGTPALEVASQSPAVCRATAIREPRATDEVGRSHGWIQLDGLSQGVCRFTVRYPNARGGAGLDAPFAMSVR